MKKLLLATSALFSLAVAPASAADLSPRMPLKAPAATQAIWDWTGFYVGGYVGLALNHSHASDPTGAIDGALEFLGTGFTGGATVGYNWQVAANWVLGIEGDIGYFGLNRNVHQFNETTLFVNQETDWLATLRARVGYTNGPNLSYVTGGAAWVHAKDSLVSDAGPDSTSDTKTGWVIGTGTETMLGGGWTAKAETLYVNTGSGDTIDNGDFAYKAEHRYYTQRFGVNYLFGGKPTPAPQMYNWSGFYAGIIGGSSIAQTKIDDPTGNSVGEFGNTGTGYNAGGVLGFNYQFAPALVAGVEGDFSWFGIRHGVDDYNDSLALYTIKTHWLATARARLGYSSGPALFYVTGGGAWVNLNESWDFGSGPASATKTLSGYSVGGGIETVLWGGLTSRTEYLFVDVGRGTLLIDPSVTPVQGDHQYHLFRSSLTYKFGG